jgi:predicted nucleic acid-binding protein
VRFWDSSAVAPLLVDEPASETVLDLLRSDSEMIAWWGTPVECISAIARREREGNLPVAGAHAAFARLRELAPSWAEVNPSNRVRSVALRLLRTHALGAADSLQLAAAIVAAEDDPAALTLVCLD